MAGFDHFSFLAPLYEKFIPPRVPEKLLSLLDLPADGAILDAGGGTGRLAQYLVKQANQVVVADETLQMTIEALQKDGLQPTCAQTEQLPFPEQAFSRILMVDALHHVSHQPQTIQELWRVLAPGGRLVIEEPDIRTFTVKLIALAEKIALMRSHFLSPNEIEALCRFPNSRTSLFAQDGTAWVVVEKLGNID